MTRKIALAVLLALALSLAGFAQPFGQSSLESALSQGLFLNEIDSSFGWTTDFGKAPSPFVFAGVSGNPLLAANGGSAGSFAGGFYEPGTLPFSIYCGYSASTLSTATKKDGTTTTYSTANVSSGSTTTTYEYASQEATAKYALPSALGSSTFTGQGLFKVAGVSLGLYLNLNGDWSATDGDSAFYSSVTTKVNYNSAAAGSAPTAALDYTVTATASNLDPSGLPATPSTAAPVAIGTNGANSTSTTSAFYLPFSFNANALKVFGYFDLSLGKTDQSGSYERTETAHVSTAGSITDRSATISSNSSMTSFGGLVGATMPGFFLASKGAEFTAGLSIGDRVTNQSYSYAHTVKTYDGSTLNQKTAVAGGRYAYAAATYKAASLLNIGAFLSHSIPLLQSDTARFSIKPSATLSYMSDTNSAGGGILTGSERYTQALDANFAYDAGTYTKITTTVTGSPATQSSFSSSLSLPMAAELRFPGWPFGFTLGASPYVGFTWTTNTTDGSSVTTKTDTITASQATASTVVSSTNSATSSTRLTTALGENHSFGLFIPFDGKLRLDVDLNSSNLLNFESLTFQLYVPLK